MPTISKRGRAMYPVGVQAADRKDLVTLIIEIIGREGLCARF